MERAAYRVNDTDRCFHCKAELMDVVGPIAAAERAIVVLGVNVDDLGDHRPGQKAAEEAGAVFPLVTAGFTKADVRAASRQLGLRTWDKPAAACLASRIPYGTEVTVGLLGRIDRAEAALHGLGLRQVRVRHYDETARIEVDLGRTRRGHRRPRGGRRGGASPPATATSRSISRASAAATSTADRRRGDASRSVTVASRILPRLFRDRVDAGQALADQLRERIAPTTSSPDADRAGAARVAAFRSPPRSPGRSISNST